MFHEFQSDEQKQLTEDDNHQEVVEPPPPTQVTAPRTAIELIEADFEAMRRRLTRVLDR